MKAKLTVDQQLQFEGKTFRVSGIDSYKLTNIYGQVKEWLSYTLIDIADEKNRIWLGDGFAGDYLIKQWLISEEEFKQNTEKLPLNADYTGIANITFAGEQGYSIPVSEVIWYNYTTEEHDFFVIERFLEQEGTELKPSKSYYHMMKILKDLTL